MKKFFKTTAMAAALASLGTTAAMAEDLVFTLKNETNSVINAFYTSPVGEENWEDDVLAQEVLAPGEIAEVTIKDGRRACDYDMRFEFQGEELETLEDTQNLCELGEYSVTE